MGNWYVFSDSVQYDHDDDFINSNRVFVLVSYVFKALWWRGGRLH